MKAPRIAGPGEAPADCLGVDDVDRPSGGIDPLGPANADAASPCGRAAWAARGAGAAGEGPASRGGMK
jgi:hypothetical protein